MERLFIRIKRKLMVHIVLMRVLGLIGVFSLLFALFIAFKDPLGNFLSNVTFLPKTAGLFLLGNSSGLAQKDGRTNILLMGAGGAGHEAPDLTDTMIFASFGTKDKKQIMISLPRDTWIPTLRAKLNSAYYYGNQKKSGGGLILAKSAVSEIFDQPVHYVLVVDFAGFVELVNLLDGLKVEVERSFNDDKYPIPGRENDLCDGDKEYKCRYENVYFERGQQVMDGQTALKFVRSRNAQYEEGTDFARSIRQQKVILAFKDKILSPVVLFNPGKIKKMWDIINSSIATDIPREKLPIAGRLILGIKREEIKNVVLDGGTVGDAQTGFLVNPPISPKYDNQWVLVPRDGTWKEVREWVKGILYQ